MTVRLRRSQASNDFTLSMRLHLTVAQEGCHYLFVAQILAPGLELLGCLALGLAIPHQRVPEAVGVEVGQPLRVLA